jgi:hypothetical protein
MAKSFDEIKDMLFEMRNKAAIDGAGVTELADICKYMNELFNRLDKLEFEREQLRVFLKNFIGICND